LAEKQEGEDLPFRGINPLPVEPFDSSQSAFDFPDAGEPAR